MIIFFYGEDSFRSSQKLLEIKDKYLASDKSGSGLSCFDFSDHADAADVISTSSTANLLAPKRLVVVKRVIEKGSAEAQKIILEYLKKNKSNLEKDADLVLVFWEESAPRKNNALYKFLEANSKKQNFEKLAGAKLSQWIINRIKEYDASASISKGALEKLIVFLGSDTTLLDVEIQKLINYADGNIIKEEDIETLVRANIDSNIFATIDALAANKKYEALRLLHNNIERGEDPFYIFSMFVYQFRNILKIADLKEQGITNEYEISKITKMHPFVVKKSLAATRIFTFDVLKKIYQKLGAYDLAVKTGKMDMKLALDKFVAEL